MNALDADWIATQVMAGTYIEEETYAKCQAHMLRVCTYLREGTTPQLIFEDGQWLVKDLELDYDLDTVHDLLDASFGFNIGPLLERLKKQRDKAKAAERGSSATTQPLSRTV